MVMQINGIEFTDAEVQGLAKLAASQINLKHDPASTTLTATPLHGVAHGNANQFGIFSYPGVKPDRFTTLARPDSVLSALPFFKTDLYNEIIEIMTGQTAASDTNAETACDDPCTYGQLKTCQQTYSLGRIHFKTKLADLSRMGLRRNRADVPGRIINTPPTDNPLIPQVPGNLAISDTMSLLQKEFYESGVGVERAASQITWIGTAGGTSNSYCGIDVQWAGFDAQIKTGYTDAVSGVLCPAADSVVASFNAAITGTDTNGLDFVEAAHDVQYALDQRASKFGMAPWTGFIAMRPEHFKRATDVWACAYATYRCKNTTAADNPVNRDGMQVQALRMQMLTGKFLLFDGREIPVVTDEGILREVVANGTYMSDMYWIPTYYAGTPLTYFEYVDMGNQYAQEFANFPVQENDVINNGLYMVGSAKTPFCKEIHFIAKLRMILETPFLAGRLDDTQYTFYAQTRDFLPGMSMHADGGVTYRS